MITTIILSGRNYKIDLAAPISIGITVKPGKNNVNAFYAQNPHAEPVVAGSFIGSTEEGGPVNFFNLSINPHGNGTHTECVGHIAKEKYFVTECFDKHFFLCELISIKPMKETNGDMVIYREQLKTHLKHQNTEAVVIRTLPNDKLKTVAKYSGHNPAYLHYEATAFLAENNVQHLLLDLPSVDREEDEGKLLAHKAFWHYPENPRTKATITELIYVPEEIQDGLYFISIQPAPIEMDAATSNPVLYKILA
jgi:arylformamidase